MDGDERVRLYEKFKAASSNFEKSEKSTDRYGQSPSEGMKVCHLT